MFVDLPFLTYQVSVPEAIRNAGRVLQETGAHGVKLEGGRPHGGDGARAGGARAFPVIGHLGLTPQSVHALGGYRVQGRDEQARRTGCSPTRKALEEAGACAIVLELLPAPARARGSRKSLTIPTIGIGAGAGCDGQVLVLHDMLGLNEQFNPEVPQALRRARRGGPRTRCEAYADEVRDGKLSRAGAQLRVSFP